MVDSKSDIPNWYCQFSFIFNSKGDFSLFLKLGSTLTDADAGRLCRKGMNKFGGIRPNV